MQIVLGAVLLAPLLYLFGRYLSRIYQSVRVLRREVTRLHRHELTMTTAFAVVMIVQLTAQIWYNNELLSEPELFCTQDRDTLNVAAFLSLVAWNSFLLLNVVEGHNIVFTTLPDGTLVIHSVKPRFTLRGAGGVVCIYNDALLNEAARKPMRRIASADYPSNREDK